MAQAYRIKHDIGTAVSIDLVVGHNADGDEIIEPKIFLPGATLPANVRPYVLKQLEAGDEHLCSLVEKVGGDPLLPVAPDLLRTMGPTEEEIEAATATADYEHQKVDDLQAQADERGLEVEGTGSGGNVLKEDLVKALKADDESKLSDNPFAQ